MFDLESKIAALVENYGLALLLEQNDICESVVVAFLLDEGLIQLNEYFNLDAEMQEWKEMEE